MNENNMARNGWLPVCENEQGPEWSGRGGRIADCHFFKRQAIGQYKSGGVSSTLMERTYKSADDVVVEQKPRKYIVRRLTPLECSRLQGYPDDWSEIRHYEDISDEERDFWEKIRKQHAETYGKAYKPFRTKQQMVKWLNGLRTDSAEYKAYGNSVAVPCVEFVMGGIVELLRKEEEENGKPVP